MRWLNRRQIPPANAKPTARRQQGDSAEAIAARWLQRQGLRIVAQNFNCRFGEIDIIAEQRIANESELVVVEVRYRGASAAVDAALSVDARKQHRIISATRYYLSQNPSLADQPLRFDVLAIDGANNSADAIHWIRDAFQ